MRVLRRSKEYMNKEYGKGTLAHVSPKGTIAVGPSATREDLEHERAHFQLGFTEDLSESSSYRRYIKEEVAAWLRARSNLGKLNTEFVWRVTSNALDYRGATPKKVLDEVIKALKDTELELSRRERQWLLKMLRSVDA